MKNMECLIQATEDKCVEGQKPPIRCYDYNDVSSSGDVSDANDKDEEDVAKVCKKFK